MEESIQRWELLCKEQQNLAELFRKQRQNSLERINISLISLAQLILEKQGVSNPCFVASQLFDVMSENKEEETLQTTFQLFDEMPKRKMELTNPYVLGNIEDVLEQACLMKQTTTVNVTQCQGEALKHQMEKVSPSVTESYSLPCSVIDLNPEPQSAVTSYTPNNLKPNPTFRSPLITTSWTQNTPNRHDFDLFRIQGQNLVNQILCKQKIESKHLHMPCALEDPILGVTFACKDTSPNKLKLGVGAYWTEKGKPLNVVKLQMEKPPDRFDKLPYDLGPNGKGSIDDGDLQTINPYVGNILLWTFGRRESILRVKIKGPIDGFFVAIKDNICTPDMPSTGGSRFLENFRASYDARLVKKLKEKGAIVIGKTNLDEFGMGRATGGTFLVTSKPWGLSQVPGGSSGQFAAAVPDRQCAVSLGSYTGGSVRLLVPICGVVSLKPTYSRVSRFGLLAYVFSVDVIGCLVKSVADTGILLHAISDYDICDATSNVGAVLHFISQLASSHLVESRLQKRLKVGLIRETFDDDVDYGVKSAISNAAPHLTDLGSTMTEVLIEVVENHMSQVIVVDEIGTNTEAMVASTIAEIGMVHHSLGMFVGGIQRVKLRNEEAKHRGVQKTVLGRKIYEDGSPYKRQDANYGNMLLISIGEFAKDKLLPKNEFTNPIVSQCVNVYGVVGLKDPLIVKVSSLVSLNEVEGTFPDGVKLITVHEVTTNENGNLELAFSDYQATYMGPIELLATPRYEHLLKLLTTMNDDQLEPSIVFLTRSILLKQVRIKALQNGHISMVIGTHSLIYDSVELSALSITVVDEQRLLGIIQRGRFNSKLYYNAVSRIATAIIDGSSKGDVNMEIMSTRAKQLLQSISEKKGRHVNSAEYSEEIPQVVELFKNQINLAEVKFPLGNFETFKEFFIQDLTLGARQLIFIVHDKVVVCASQCCLMEFENVEESARLQIEGWKFSTRALKGKEISSTICVDGYLVIFPLAPQDYNRFHSPISGTIVQFQDVPGYLHTVNSVAVNSEYCTISTENKLIFVCMDATIITSALYLLTMVFFRAVATMDKLTGDDFQGTVTILVAVLCFFYILGDKNDLKEGVLSRLLV